MCVCVQKCIGIVVVWKYMQLHNIIKLLLCHFCQFVTVAVVVVVVVAIFCCLHTLICELIHTCVCVCVCDRVMCYWNCIIWFLQISLFNARNFTHTHTHTYIHMHTAIRWFASTPQKFTYKHLCVGSSQACNEHLFSMHAAIASVEMCK